MGVESMLYFAYGSNMCLARLRARVPSSVPQAVGYLTGYRLVFNKRSADGSGKGNIERTRNRSDRVYGVVFEFDAAERHQLDQAEYGYEAVTVAVHLVDSAIEAMTYSAISKDARLKPYHWYKAFVVQGAKEHGLPSDYIAQLELVLSVDDADLARQAHNEAILKSRFRN